MKNILVLIFSILLCSEGTLISQQKVWSLAECITYAIDNNIQIKQQVLQTMSQKNSLDLAKFKILPTINGSASHNYSFGRALDQTTYQYANTVQSNNFYAGTSLNLFSGLQTYNSIKQNEYLVLAGQQDLQNIKDNISMTVALDYLQILLNKELVTANANQLQITLQQIEKTKKLVDAGSVAKGNLLQIQSQAAQEELQLINMKNQLDISYLNLTQMLELQTPAGFEVNAPVISIDTSSFISGNILEIYNQALGKRPDVKSSELNLTASEMALKVAKGGRSPRLSLSTSFSTGYSDARKKLIIDPVTNQPEIDPVTGQPLQGNYSFASQVNDNINWGLGFSLNVPILNGWQVNKNISNSKLNIENSRYALEATKKQLYKTIQQAYSDAVAALKKHTASIKAVSSAEESFRYTEQKFNVGLVTSVDYNAAKTQLLKAQSDLAQSKYEFIFKTKVLDFYKGMPLNLPN